MVTTVMASTDPENAWQQQAFESLERSLGQSLDYWSYDRASGWVRQQSSSEQRAIEASQPDLAALVESAARHGKPMFQQSSSGQYMFAIPLGDRIACTARVQTDNPDVFLGLTEVAASFFRQQEELSRLREENDFFIKQVSDDFEELTFLRSMAERLGLGDSTHTIEQLVLASLPELGKSAHSEELHYVLNTTDEPKVLASWRTEEIDSPCSRDEEAVSQLIEQHTELVQTQPVIKNGYGRTKSGQALPGVRDFIIVPVVGEEAPEGWFVAMNRLHEDHPGSSDFPEWRLNQHEFGTSEASLLSTAAAMTASHANNLSLFQEREVLLVNVVRSLVSAVEAKDQYTCGHSERVALYAKRLAEQVGYDKEECELLYLTGLLHDVGKIAINDAILNKPDRLTDEEFAEIQRHPEEGWRILQGLEQLNYVLPGVLHHHERFDGKGYPDGLAGYDIPQDGRVLAVADAYDAMTSDRAYRTGMPHEKAVAILQDGAGTQWDPEIVAAFFDILPEITAIRENYRPRQQPNRVATQVASSSK